MAATPLNTHARKRAVIEYMLASVSREEFDKALQINIENMENIFEFLSYDEFANFQEAMVISAEEDQLKFLELMKNKILPNTKWSDTNNMKMADVKGFVFSKRGTLVLLEMPFTY